MSENSTNLLHRIRPGTRVSLDDIATNDTAGLKHADAEALLQRTGAELAELQELLYGSGSHSVLIVLQGMDTSGKDGTIRRALTWLNPQACRVESFKAPSDEEAAHDFLWRIHRVAPERGFMAIFNRSHYEDVLAARVRNIVPRETWSARYEQINNFERLLVESGTLLLKFFLHISKGEQEKRLLAREADRDKAWKLSVSDWEDRDDWHAYRQAYEDAIERCSTEHAPWYVVPSDRKWFRDTAVATTIVERLRQRRAGWEADLKSRGRVQLEALRRYRAEHPLP